jgi:serine/threonine-protein kinase
MRKMPTPAYETIGKYIVKRIIRSTGSSDLYECYDPDLQTRVALKVFDVKKRLLRKLPYDVASWRRRFMREARILAQIDHPHVINVRELSYIDEKPFYVMPYVTTNLLYEMGRDGPAAGYAPEIQDAPTGRALDVVRACDILFQLASALSAFHGRGLVHRDLKPANVLLTQLNVGLVKLCDTGMVKFPDSEESQAGYWIGTEDFIAPEQKRDSKSVDARADIFALGVLGYRMLTGELPRGVFETPVEFDCNIPEALSRLVMLALSSKLDKRPVNALAFLKEIAPIRAKIRMKGA